VTLSEKAKAHIREKGGVAAVDLVSLAT
jgi:hypothetical protein